MATKKRTYRGGDEDEDERAAPPSTDLVESKLRPPMHVPGTGIDVAVQVGPQAVDMTGFEGSYIKKSEQAEYDAQGGANNPNLTAPLPYGLMEVPDDPYGHTHHLKNNDHYWSGRKDQFELQFVEE
jgi:hypothetical protein